MSFITELHCHCEEISRCSELPASGAVEKYKKYGYSTLVFTNHFTDGGRRRREMTDEEYITWFFDTQEDFKKQLTDDEITILSAAEMNFEHDDILVFGVTKEILLKRPGIMRDSLEDAYKFLSPEGCIVIQAHPMRWGERTRSLSFLDGYEIYNAHPDQNSHNEIAEMWAKANDENCIMTGGSDHHDPRHEPGSGIITEEKIISEKQLADILRRKDFEIYRRKK